MIRDMQKVIAEHARSFELENLAPEDISISKFYHAGDRGDRKVLFLATQSGRPLCMLKIIRDKQFNRKLENECRAQRAAAHALKEFTVPAVYFESNLQGSYCYAEEVMQGSAISRQESRTVAGEVIRYQLTISRRRRAPAGVIARALGSIDRVDSELSGLIDACVAACAERTDVSVTSDQHGDLTRMNIFKEKAGRLSIVDWEHAGERTVWGVDGVHYLVRSYGISSSEEMASVLQVVHQPIDAVTVADFLLAYHFDRLYTHLFKKMPEVYYTVIQQLHAETHV